MTAFLLPRLEFLWPTETVKIDLLDKLLNAMWQPPTVAWHLDQIARGGLLAYSTPKGLVLLETVDWPKARELRVYGIAGRDILKNGEAIVRDLKRIAEYKGCSMIGGEGIPRGWVKAAPKLGFKPVSTHYVMELDHG